MTFKLRTLITGVAAAMIGMGAMAEAPVTLTVASFPSFDESVKIAIPAYKKIKPNVTIKLVSLAFNDHHNAMTTALATGANVPDVMGIEIGYIGKFDESPALEDLKRPPFNGMSLRSQFLPFCFAQGIGGSGRLVAIPADVGPGTLFYRKDIMDKAGVTEKQLTQSWDSFIAAGKIVRQKTGAYMVAAASDLYQIYIRANLKDGEGIFFDKNGKPNVDNARFRRAMQLARAAREADIDGKIPTWSSEWSEAFKSDKLATQMIGAWLEGHFKSWLAPNTAGKWRASQLPEGAYASWGGSFYAIPTKAKNKAEAWNFIKYLCTNRTQQLACFKQMGAYPAVKGAADKKFMSEPVAFLGGQKARLLWEAAANKIPAIKVNKYDPVAIEIMGSALDDVLEDDADIDAAIKAAAQKLERRIR